MIMAAGIGAGTVGAQNCNNGVAAKLYPTSIRATGVGWALAVGRIGSIVGPVVGGILLSTKVDIRTIFLVAAVPPLVAAGAYLAMGRTRALEPAAHEL
jgi:AAHS family 4-hydroxybenzoate transporter-like MFS transporter